MYIKIHQRVSKSFHIIHASQSCCMLENLSTAPKINELISFK